MSLCDSPSRSGSTGAGPGLGVLRWAGLAWGAAGGSRGLDSSGHREPKGKGQLAGGQSPPSPEAAAQDHGEAPGELGPGSHSSGLEQLMALPGDLMPWPHSGSATTDKLSAF